MQMLKGAAILFLILFAQLPVHAMKWSRTVPINASLIEYEIAVGPEFKSSQLVDQDYSKTNKLSGELPQGLYYLRYRDANNAQWSKPIEILLTNDVRTELVEPENKSIFESSINEPVIAFRWKAVGGASSYKLYLSSLTGQRKTINSLGAFARAELGYGKWNAQVGVFFGKKRLHLSKNLSFEIVPSIQDAAEFIQPRSDDIVEAYKKIPLEISRTYIAQKASLEILSLDKPNFSAQSIELDEEESIYEIPALAPGKYQITLIDQLNSKASVKSNIKLIVQKDPLEIDSRGFQSILDFNLGILTGTSYQKTNTFNPNRADHRGGVFAPLIEGRLLTHYFDPYILEFRIQSLLTEYDSPEGLPQIETDPHFDWLYSASLIYDSNIVDKPSALLFKTGLFGKRINQLTEDDFFGGGERDAEFSGQNFFGLSIGAEYWWGAWSQNWQAKANINFLVPLLSTVSNVENSSHGMNPAMEISMTFSKYWAEYMFYTITPRIKTERWVRKSSTGGEAALEYYLVSGGLSLGIGIDI